MTLVHDYFHTRDLQQFQRLLDGATNDRKPQTGPASSSQLSTSGGKSWNRPSPLASISPQTLDVNARDWLGRTPLHLACSSIENIEYVRALLRHPKIDVNTPDTESQWTPLHRAMYHANLPAAQLLLQHPDIDISPQDSEGYTAFDLYNSTVNGIKPDLCQVNAELFTWGANRNAALGLGDGNDRTYPDQVAIQAKQDSEEIRDRALVERFTPISIRQIGMSKLHTAIVTSEDSGNLRLCGFGSGGRLGPGQHTQYSLKSLPQFHSTITSVALGQDHTLALTKSGEVLSWGLNRFSQLGYVVETTIGKMDEPIQPTPKKIVGPLKKVEVIGVAASKNASACWTSDELFTWGTNTGQLGYDKSAQPLQIIPRIVTKFSQPVIALALTDTAMVAILRSQQVECIWNDRHYRVNFPAHAFPAEIQPFRPRQAIKDPYITKVTSCGDLFAALSSNGEVFTFSPPSDSSDGQDYARNIFKPQRVRALSKKFSAVKDVALGTDGTIIICTESGHVETRIRTAKGGGGKHFKFQRIPYLQRVTQVCANSTGAFGALRVDFKPKTAAIVGNTLAEDLLRVQPFLSRFPVTDIPNAHRDPLLRTGTVGVAGEEKPSSPLPEDDGFGDDEQEDHGIDKDIDTLRSLMRIVKQEQTQVGAEEPIDYNNARLPHDADVLISIGNLHFPAHRVILAARSPSFNDILAGKQSSTEDTKNDHLLIQMEPSLPGPGRNVHELAVLSTNGVHPLSILILLHYLYTDEVLAIWDRRVYVALSQLATSLNVVVGKVKADLVVLADFLQLPHLTQVLQAPVKRAPSPSLSTDFTNLFDRTQDPTSRSISAAPDVLLELKDKVVWTFSAILRTRSEFFGSLFGEDVWTERRWGEDGVLRVDLKHRSWDVVQYVLRFVLCGKDEELFRVLPFTQTVDDVLEFMFQVMAIADELLLDRLILICSSIILPFLNIHNCCYILSEATHYHAYKLVNSVQEYMAANMESLLEQNMLDDLPYALVKQLAMFIRKHQLERASFSRTDDYVDGLMAKYWDWLEDQDIPVPFIRSTKRHNTKEIGKSRISPPTPSTPSVSKEPPRTPISRTPTAIHSRPSGDDIFSMDLGDASMASSPSVSSSAAWKVAEAPRVDMRALMAEAQQSVKPAGSPKYTTPKTGSHLPMPPSAPTTPSKNGQQQSIGLSWRQHPPVQTRLPPLPLSVPSSTPSAAAGSSSSFPKISASPSTPMRSQKPPKAITPLPSLPVPGMGPTFAPMKQGSSKPVVGARTVPGSGSGKAWTAPPPEPVAASPATSMMSFAEIQQAQQKQHTPVVDKRSLKEIQEEEEAIQAEVDFMKWWQAEESRVQEEMTALEAFSGRGGGGGGGSSGQKVKGKAGPRSSKKTKDGPKQSQPGSNALPSISTKPPTNQRPPKEAQARQQQQEQPGTNSRPTSSKSRLLKDAQSRQQQEQPAASKPRQPKEAQGRPSKPQRPSQSQAQDGGYSSDVKHK